MMPTLPVQDRPRPAPVPAAEVRRQLLDHRQAGRREAFIDLAYRYLEAVPRDPPIALELLRALVELGLGEPARELLATRPDLTEAGDTASLRQALDGLPAAAVPWARLRPRFFSPPGRTCTRCGPTSRRRSRGWSSSRATTAGFTSAGSVRTGSGNGSPGSA
ncbi:MAG: hypothetical protein ACYS1B_15225 [Planctomycetota bacterium]